MEMTKKDKQQLRNVIQKGIFMKRFLIIMVLSIAVTSFSSCFCPLIEFANKDCLTIAKSPNRILDMDTEFCYFGSYTKKWIFYQYIVCDSVISLKHQQIKINYRGKSLKFKLYCAYKNGYGWKKTDCIDITDSTMLIITIKEHLKENEELQIIEKDLFDVGDSIVTSIRIPTIYSQTKRHISNESKVKQFLWNNYDLPK